MEGKADKPPTIEEIVNLSLRHLELVCSIKGERVGVREMRKHVAWYLKGLPNSNEVKNEINTMENKGDIERVLFEYMELHY